MFKTSVPAPFDHEVVSNRSELRNVVGSAREAFLGVLATVPAGALDEPTPCEHYTVRGLLNHLLYWTPRLATAVRGESPPAPTGGENETDLVTDDWRAVLAADVGRLVKALRDPSAWDGVVPFGAAELPAHRVGAMALIEFVVHGWDLAVATGVEFRCEPEVALAVFRALEEFAPAGRQHGVFGAEVPVAENAVPIARLLGLSGRDPEWSK